jgi:hypothetical protein
VGGDGEGRAGGGRRARWGGGNCGGGEGGPMTRGRGQDRLSTKVLGLEIRDSFLCIAHSVSKFDPKNGTLVISLNFIKFGIIRSNFN